MPFIPRGPPIDSGALGVPLRMGILNMADSQLCFDWDGYACSKDRPGSRQNPGPGLNRPICRDPGPGQNHEIYRDVNRDFNI